LSLDRGHRGDTGSGRQTPQFELGGSGPP